MNKFIASITIIMICAGAATAFSRPPQQPTTTIKTMASVPAEKPDLVIVKATATRSKKGILVKYTVKNIGKAPSRPSRTKVQVALPKGMSVDHTTPALKPGDTFSTSWDYVVAKEGKYQFKVTADYPNNIHESNERNNENSVTFSIGRTL